MLWYHVCLCASQDCTNYFNVIKIQFRYIQMLCYVVVAKLFSFIIKEKWFYLPQFEMWNLALFVFSFLLLWGPAMFHFPIFVSTTEIVLYNNGIFAELFLNFILALNNLYIYYIHTFRIWMFLYVILLTIAILVLKNHPK